MRCAELFLGFLPRSLTCERAATGRKKWPYGNGNTWPISGGKNRPSRTDRLFGDHRVSCSSTVCREMFHSLTKMGLSFHRTDIFLSPAPASLCRATFQATIRYWFMTLQSYLYSQGEQSSFKTKTKCQRMGVTIWGETSNVVLSWADTKKFIFNTDENDSLDLAAEPWLCKETINDEKTSKRSDSDAVVSI